MSAVGLAVCVGCDGGSSSETCAASNEECIERVANENPNEPVHETGREFRALRLGDDQCNIRESGNHLGNPTNTTGGPVMLDASGAVFISQPRECVPFQFFMNYCNFGVTTSDALTDTWALLDSDMTGITEDPISIPSLEPCECAPASVPVGGLPAQDYVLQSLFHPGRSFTFPFRFRVPATAGGVVTCQ